jgi:small subunit ribosomal protein S20
MVGRPAPREVLLHHWTFPRQSLNFCPFATAQICAWCFVTETQETITVAHSLSAKKRIRQTLKRNARNRARKELLKTQVKAFATALAGGDAGKAETELRKVTQRLDKIAAKHTIHKNAAARRRSRLTKRLNALKAGGGKGTKAAATA